MHCKMDIQKKIKATYILEWREYINGWKLGQINNSVVFSLLMIAMSFYNTDWMGNGSFNGKAFS